MGILFLTSFANNGQVTSVMSNSDGYPDIYQGVPVFGTTDTLRHIFFPLLWAIIILFDGGIRYITTRIFGDRNINLKNTLTVTIYAMIPLITAGGTIGIINDLFPLVNFDGVFQAFLRLLLEILILILAFFWEGFVCVHAFRNMAGQNYGRAILTWLAPTIMWFIFGISGIILLNMIA